MTSLFAGEKIEIKYLAPNAEILQQIKTDLHLDDTGNPEKMEIYFFDTPSLALLKEQNLILRLRKKKDVWEFTVKERPAGEKAQNQAKPGEVVMEKTVAHPKNDLSYSLESSPSDAAVKDAIEKNAVQGLLSSDQQEFLQNRPKTVSWVQVRCFPKIQAVRWDLPQIEKFDAEDWKFAGGEVLELSLKAKEKDAADAEAKFSKFLIDKGLKPEESGGMKTSTVLEILKQQLQTK